MRIYNNFEYFKIEAIPSANETSAAMAAIVAILKKANKNTRHRSETSHSSDLLEKLPPDIAREIDMELGMLLTG